MQQLRPKALRRASLALAIRSRIIIGSGMIMLFRTWSNAGLIRLVKLELVGLGERGREEVEAGAEIWIER